MLIYETKIHAVTKYFSKESETFKLATRINAEIAKIVIEQFSKIWALLLESNILMLSLRNP
jgi:hypothetical protein